MSENVGHIARLWYQDNTSGQLLVGEIAWSPDAELVAAIPVSDERLQRIAVFARWPELPEEVGKWLTHLADEGLDEYKRVTDSTGNMMSVLHCGQVMPLYWHEWTMSEARSWLAKVVGNAK